MLMETTSVNESLATTPVLDKIIYTGVATRYTVWIRNVLIVDVSCAFHA